MLELIKEINWLIILNNSKSFSEPSARTFIRKVKNTTTPPKFFNGHASFLFELDGEGNTIFSGELRYGMSDDRLIWLIEDYSRKSLFDKQGGTTTLVGCGEHIEGIALFTGKTRKVNFTFPMRFLKKNLENQNYAIEHSSLWYKRVWAKNSPFAPINQK